MKPRPYQKAVIDSVKQLWATGSRRVLAQVPTGGGKSLIASELMAGARSVIFMAHRKNLIEQASRHLDSVGVRNSIIAPGYPMRGSIVRVASVETLVRRLVSVDRPDLLIIDEAHHSVASSFRRIAEWAPDARHLGLTATPMRLDGQGLDDMFDSMVEGPTTAALIRDGYLSPFRYFAPPAPSGDIEEMDEDEIEALMDRPAITGDAVEHYQRIADGLPALVFCSTIRHAEHVASAFKTAGVRAMALHSGLPEEAAIGMLRMLRDGSVDVLTNCGMVDEGTDVPGVTVMIDLAPTASLSRFLQRCGRVLRPVYSKAGSTRIEQIARGPKPFAVILDHAGNIERHGAPDAPREWTLTGAARGSERATLKRCESCYSMVVISARECPECGAEFVTDGRQRQGPTVGDGELVEVGGAAGLYEAIKAGGWSVVQARGIAATMGQRPELGERIFYEVFAR